MVEAAVFLSWIMFSTPIFGASTFSTPVAGDRSVIYATWKSPGFRRSYVQSLCWQKRPYPHPIRWDPCSLNFLVVISEALGRFSLLRMTFREYYQIPSYSFFSSFFSFSSSSSLPSSLLSPELDLCHFNFSMIGLSQWRVPFLHLSQSVSRPRWLGSGRRLGRIQCHRCLWCFWSCRGHCLSPSFPSTVSTTPSS